MTRHDSPSLQCLSRNRSHLLKMDGGFCVRSGPCGYLYPQSCRVCVCVCAVSSCRRPRPKHTPQTNTLSFAPTPVSASRATEPGDIISRRPGDRKVNHYLTAPHQPPPPPLSPYISLPLPPPSFPPCGSGTPLAFWFPPSSPPPFSSLRFHVNSHPQPPQRWGNMPNCPTE